MFFDNWIIFLKLKFYLLFQFYSIIIQSIMYVNKYEVQI